MPDSETVVAMRRKLGSQLAALRRYAGLTQHALADLATCTRSTVSLAEIGRSSNHREFWETTDKMPGATGALDIGFDQIIAVRDAEERAAWCAGPKISYAPVSNRSPTSQPDSSAASRRAAAATGSPITSLLTGQTFSHLPSALGDRR